MKCYRFLLIVFFAVSVQGQTLWQRYGKNIQYEVVENIPFDSEDQKIEFPNDSKLRKKLTRDSTNFLYQSLVIGDKDYVLRTVEEKINELSSEFDLSNSDNPFLDALKWAGKTATELLEYELVDQKNPDGIASLSECIKNAKGECNQYTGIMTIAFDKIKSQFPSLLKNVYLSTENTVDNLPKHDYPTIFYFTKDVLYFTDFDPTYWDNEDKDFHAEDNRRLTDKNQLFYIIFYRDLAQTYTARDLLFELDEKLYNQKVELNSLQEHAKFVNLMLVYKRLHKKNSEYNVLKRLMYYFDKYNLLGTEVDFNLEVFYAACLIEDIQQEKGWDLIKTEQLTQYLQNVDKSDWNYTYLEQLRQSKL
ncbi:hypothetical protein MRY82_02955 [bacterium]|nr:hypothetical protein [bacterium]